MDFSEKRVQVDTKQIKTPQRGAETAIPTSYIRTLIVQPENAGDKSRVLSWLLRKWEEEQNDRLICRFQTTAMSALVSTMRHAMRMDIEIQSGMNIKAAPQIVRSSTSPMTASSQL